MNLSCRRSGHRVVRSTLPSPLGSESGSLWPSVGNSACSSSPVTSSRKPVSGQLVVFLIIITTFAVSDAQQHKVFTFGILLALIMRAVFIGIGAALLDAFSVVLLFGLLLIYTAIQLFRHRNEDPYIQGNIMIRGARRLLPVTSSTPAVSSSPVLIAAECFPTVPGSDCDR